MSDAVLVALVGGPLLALVAWVLKKIDSKADKAKQEVTQNSAEVELASSALRTMEILGDNLRKEYEREHARAEGLELDLKEEKALTKALLSRLNHQTGREDG